jgi:GTPase
MKTKVKQYPLVTLIGRTNVGKSTIFNRLTEKKQAIVSAIPGTTRDERFGICEWEGKMLTISDTAGLDVESDADIDKKAIAKAREAVKVADLILFVVDVRDGILPQDREYALFLKKQKKPVILVINKVDSTRQLNAANEFYQLGFDKVYSISAKTGSGTGDLLDEMYDLVADVKVKTVEIDEDKKQIKIAIIGKPNVGKSSLMNKIAGEERAIVSPVAHTTRDSQDFEIDYEDYKLTFIDTAGIIKKRKINNTLHEQSIEQSKDSIRRADLVLLMIDADEPVTQQDKNISGEILEANKSLIFVVNKWDLLEEKYEHSDKEFITFLHKHFPYLTWAPIVFTSAKTGFKVERLIKVVTEIYENQHSLVAQEDLNDLTQFIIKKQSPRQTKGVKPPYIHTITQVGTNPLTFDVLANQAENIHFSYRRYIQNQIRKKFNYMGCGIKLVTTEKPEQRVSKKAI